MCGRLSGWCQKGCASTGKKRRLRISNNSHNKSDSLLLQFGFSSALPPPPPPKKNCSTTALPCPILYYFHAFSCSSPDLLGVPPPLPFLLQLPYPLPSPTLPPTAALPYSPYHTCSSSCPPLFHPHPLHPPFSLPPRSAIAAQHHHTPFRLFSHSVMVSLHQLHHQGLTRVPFLRKASPRLRGEEQEGQGFSGSSCRWWDKAEDIPTPCS